MEVPEPEQVEERNDDEAVPMVPPRHVPNDAPSDDQDIDSTVLEAQFRELLESPESRRAFARLLSMRSVAEFTAGVIPPPSFVERYETIRPGSADAFIARYEQEGNMAAVEQQHRHAIENRIVDHNIAQETEALDRGNRRADIGQVCGFALALLFLIAAVWVMYYGMHTNHPNVAIVGGGAIIAEIVGVVILFVRERSSITQEMAQKERMRTVPEPVPQASQLTAGEFSQED
jgi:uncharacterized membrane protein